MSDTESTPATQPGAHGADLQASAWIASLTVVAGFLYYWWGEIQSVRELLDMAYG